MKIVNTYISYFESTNSHFDNEYYKIHELENGDFISENQNGKLIKINPRDEIILNLKSKNNCLADYTKTQTPIERLRNKLSPFMTIVELLSNERGLHFPFNESEADGKDKNDMFERLLKICSEYKTDVKKYLSDCEVFYNK
jgi:hypothetical protein